MGKVRFSNSAKVFFIIAFIITVVIAMFDIRFAGLFIIICIGSVIINIGARYILRWLFHLDEGEDDCIL